ncbi:hypothetical protein GDO81_027800, partial [Engystomops pustulosus]
MMSPSWVFILVVVAITFISGIFWNVTVVTFYINNWGQTLRSGGCDKIVLATAAATALLQVMVTFGGILFYSQLFLLLPNAALAPFLFVFQCFIDLCCWKTSWLSVCYCLKLVNFSHQILLWIKSRFPSALTSLLLGSTLGSVLINLPFLWATIHMPLNNSSSSSAGIGMDLSFKVVKVTLGTSVPFLLSLFCILLSVRSLLRHVWRIQKNGSKYSQLAGHVRAVRTMVLRLVLDLTFCIVVMGILLFSFSIGLILGSLSWIFIMLYPSLQALILITGSLKLMKHLF